MSSSLEGSPSAAAAATEASQSSSEDDSSEPYPQPLNEACRWGGSLSEVSLLASSESDSASLVGTTQAEPFHSAAFAAEPVGAFLLLPVLPSDCTNKYEVCSQRWAVYEHLVSMWQMVWGMLG